MVKTKIQEICENAEKRIVEELENHWNIQLDRFGREYVYIPYPSESEILDRFETDVECFWEIYVDYESFDLFSVEDIELLKKNSISNILAIHKSIAKIRTVHEKSRVLLKENPSYYLITTQVELDEVSNDYDGVIVVLGSHNERIVIKKRYKKAVEVIGCSSVELRNYAFAKILDEVEVWAYDNSRVEAHDSTIIKAYDNAKIYREKNSMVTVELYDNATIMEIENDSYED